VRQIWRRRPAQVQLPEGGIVFENAYTAEDTEVNTDPADAKSYFNKVLTGRGWLGTDEFTFTITPQDGAPAAGGGGRRELDSEHLAGLRIVVSGKFASRNRDEMKALIDAHGGRNLAAVSAATDYLVAGEKTGPAKVQKARRLGIPVITEEELLAMIEHGAPERDAERAAAEQESAGDKEDPTLF